VPSSIIKIAMAMAAISALVSGCGELKTPTQVEGVSAQDPYYMIQSVKDDGSSEVELP
jgi:hypothetical protein